MNIDRYLRISATKHGKFQKIETLTLHILNTVVFFDFN